ncbi:MAG TPA: agmatinase [Euzebyales bacterium]|nr:agmatinase [Euzebyales bacterium]
MTPDHVPFGPDRSAFHANAPFAGVPVHRIEELEAGMVAIVGAPFDWGTTHRPGARFGPRAIREGDYLQPDGMRPHLTAGIDPLRALPVVDVGDIDVVPGYVERSLDLIVDHVRAIAAAGAVPFLLGGDHTVTYAGASAVAGVVGAGELALIHFDAHADTGETHYGQLHGHGTPMRRLIESGAVPGHRFVQIGLRGYWPPPETVAWMRDQRMRSFFMADITRRGLDAVVDEAVDAALGGGARGVYVSVDIDVVDPGMAPGTGTPEPGGISARDLLDTVQRLGRELEVVGADLVEVAPHYDQPADITARLGNRVVLELLTGMALRRSGAQRRSS